MAQGHDQDSGMPGRESGKPGGEKGRVDDVRGSPVYPGSGPYPSGDAEIRTPGSFAHGQVDEQGRPVEGGSEITMTNEGIVLGGATPPSSSPPQGSAPDKGTRSDS
jgi:hypothetical protein